MCFYLAKTVKSPVSIFTDAPQVHVAMLFKGVGACLLRNFLLFVLHLQDSLSCVENCRTRPLTKSLIL